MVARTDRATDAGILDELLGARRATAFFARKLNELTDEELDLPSLLPGWSRREVVAHLGYNARGLCRLVTWAQTGVETPMYASAEQRDREIARGATLQPHALRHLFDHAAVSLSVEWRDTDDAGWAALVRTAQGRELPLSMTPWLRTRELWMHAIDLDNGARWADIPEPVIRRILQDIVNVWVSRVEPMGFVLVDGSGETVVDGRASSSGAAVEVAEVVEVRGPLPELLVWAAGRGVDASELVAHTADGGAIEVPRAPRWI